MTTSSTISRQIRAGVLLILQGTNPNHWDNVGLREAMRVNAPLVYFQGILPGRTSRHGPCSSSRPAGFAGVCSRHRRGRHARDELRRVVLAIMCPRRATSFAESTPRASISSDCTRVDPRARARRLPRGCASAASDTKRFSTRPIVADNDPGESRRGDGLALCKLHHAAFDSSFSRCAPTT